MVNSAILEMFEFIKNVSELLVFVTINRLLLFNTINRDYYYYYVCASMNNQ